MPLPSTLIAIADGVIDLGWGHPSPNLHPLANVKKAAELLLSSGEVTALQYGATQGFGPLLESLTEFLSRQEAYGFSIEPQQLFLASGASQAIDLATTLFAREGDTVFVEEPTYYLIEQIFRDHHLNVVGVPTDEYGLDTDALEEMLSERSISSPKLLYTIPTFHNPMGNMLPTERRKKLVELAHQHGFIVIADEVYQLLYYGELPPPPIVSFDDSEDGVVLSLGSFSKILAPGLRLGWVQANPKLIKRFVTAGMSASGGGLNHFTSTLVHTTLIQGILEENISRLREAYSARVDSMSRALRNSFDELIEFSVPGGGYFFWAKLLSGVNTDTLLPIAQDSGVSYRPGTAFSSEGNFDDCIRLAFSLYESDELAEGIARIANAVEKYHSIVR